MTEQFEQVSLTPSENVKRLYAEIPDDPQLYEFDPSDKKFLAAALASGHNPAIVNAVDSDWNLFHAEITAHGVIIEQLCD